MDEKEILGFWFEQRDLEESTRKRFKTIINDYSQFIKKSIKEIYDEALREEKENVFLPERGYSHDILKYQKHLKKEGKAKGTIRTYIGALQSFYDTHYIRPPKIKFKNGDVGLEKNFGHLLTKDEIRKLISVSNTRDRAIIYTMAMTGMSQREVRDLDLKKFVQAISNELKIDIRSLEQLFQCENELGDKVLTLEVFRRKINYRYITFLPPEATAAIFVYLKERQYGRNRKVRIKTFNDRLFLSEKGVPLTPAAISRLYVHVGIRAGFEKDHEPGAFRSWRSHGLRRYFISTIMNHLHAHEEANFMAGHKISEQDRAYWRADPSELKKVYLEALPYLSLENTEVKTIHSDEYNELLKQREKEEKQYQEQLTKLQEQEEKLDSKIKMIDRIEEKLNNKLS
jgi:integrase